MGLYAARERYAHNQPIDATLNLSDETDIYFTKFSKTFSRNGQQRRPANLLVQASIESSRKRGTKF